MFPVLVCSKTRSALLCIDAWYGLAMIFAMRQELMRVMGREDRALELQQEIVAVIGDRYTVVDADGQVVVEAHGHGAESEVPNTEPERPASLGREVKRENGPEGGGIVRPVDGFQKRD
jgi:hypothetical protein